MKRGGMLLVAVFTLALSSAVVSAQGLPALPGLPSFGNMFGGGDSCEDAGPGPFVLDGIVAWNYQTVALDFRTLEFNFGDSGAFKHSYRFNGVKLGVSGTAVSRTGVGAMATFSIVAVGSSKEAENYNEAFPFPAFFQGTRYWNTKNDNYSFTGLGFYRLYRSAALVGGFRWDHLETSFDRPDAHPTIWSLHGDEASLTVNIYQPFVGAMVDQGGASRVLKVGFIAWPQLYGSVKYGETFGNSDFAGIAGRVSGLTAKVNEGYFWEVFGEYGLREQMLMGAALSVFGSWTQYHLKGTFNIASERAGVGPSFSDLFDISMHRNSWAAGVKLDVPFALPGSFYF